MEQPQQNFGILQSGRLLQEDEPVYDRKIGGREPGPPALHLAIKSGPCFWYFFEQLGDGSLHGAGMTEINSHPVGRRKICGVRGSHLARRSLVLRLPAQRVVVPPMPEVKK